MRNLYDSPRNLPRYLPPHPVTWPPRAPSSLLPWPHLVALIRRPILLIRLLLRQRARSLFSSLSYTVGQAPVAASFRKLGCSDLVPFPSPCCIAATSHLPLTSLLCSSRPLVRCAPRIPTTCWTVTSLNLPPYTEPIITCAYKSKEGGAFVDRKPCPVYPRNVVLEQRRGYLNPPLPHSCSSRRRERSRPVTSAIYVEVPLQVQPGPNSFIQL